MAKNPLTSYFRQASTYVPLPTRGRWYAPEDITTTDDGELAVHALTAIDDILLNTPDAMLNGVALEKVVRNCAPDIHNVKKLMLPDLEALFVGIKSATTGGKADYDRKCPSCGHENTFELNCRALLDGMSFIEDDDLRIQFADDLVVHIRPYDFEMRQMFIRREFEEEKALRALEGADTGLDEMQKAALLGESVDRLSRMTFQLVSRSIEKIVILKDNNVVSDPEHINEWLTGISKTQADMVIEAVNRINATGVNKSVKAQCQSCGHQWEDALSFDPTSFFGKRS